MIPSKIINIKCELRKPMAIFQLVCKRKSNSEGLFRAEKANIFDAHFIYPQTDLSYTELISTKCTLLGYKDA